MVSIVASTSRSANSLAMCPSKSAPRSRDSFVLVADIGLSPFCESLVFITVFSFHRVHQTAWTPQNLQFVEQIRHALCEAPIGANDLAVYPSAVGASQK